TNVRPASITSTLTPTAGTGDLVKDVGALVKAFYAGRSGATQAVLIMDGAHASQLIGTTGTPGTSFNMPLIVSGAASTNVIVLDPTGVVVADDGIVLDVSRYAALEMSDSPTAPTATTVLTDLWSNNLTGFRVERFLNWQAVPGAVQYLTEP